VLAMVIHDMDSKKGLKNHYLLCIVFVNRQKPWNYLALTNAYYRFHHLAAKQAEG
jgi:hypothetical protein